METELEIASPYVTAAENLLSILEDPESAEDYMINEFGAELIYIQELGDRVAELYGLNLADELVPTLRYILDGLCEKGEVRVGPVEDDEYLAEVSTEDSEPRRVHIAVFMACLQALEKPPFLRHNVMNGDVIVLKLD